MSLDPEYGLALHRQDVQRRQLDRQHRPQTPRQRRRRGGHTRQVPAADAWSSPDPDTYRALLGRLAESVVVVTGHDDVGRPRGMTISSFSSVSLRPPLVLFCVGVHSSTWAAIGGQGRFAVNVLAADQHDVAARFAAPEDRFAGIDHEYTADGVPVLRGGLATLVCHVEDGLRAGDHDVVIGRVVGARTSNSTDGPLAYHAGRYAAVSALSLATVGDSS